MFSMMRDLIATIVLVLLFYRLESAHIKLQPKWTKLSGVALITAVTLSTAFVPRGECMEFAQDYDSYASSYNQLDGGDAAEVLGLNKMRADVGREAKGDVLEVAVGTGLQLDYLNPSQIKTMTGIDYSAGMLSEAKRRVESIGGFPNVKLQQMDAGAMDGLADDSFDTVQSTFSFCVFDEPEKVMREMKRVVRPNGGRVVLLENSRSTLAPLAALQDLTEPIITPLSKNCRWNVNVPALAMDAGLKLERKSEIQAGTIFYGVYSK